MSSNELLILAAAFILVAAVAAIIALNKTPARFCFGEKCFSGEIADNPVKKALGLMFRDSIPEDYGMVFPMRKVNTSFWMQNVKFPIELICVKDGRVSEIITMETCEKTNGCVYYRPKAEIDYAVETNVGFSERNGVGEGAAFSLQ
jgi:uncharacterized membrane protein (UPF0127 family)